MVKNRISFDIDVPNGYTASVKKKKKQIKRRRSPRKKATRVRVATDDDSIRVVRPLEVMMPVNKRAKPRKRRRAKPRRRKSVNRVRPIELVMPSPPKPAPRRKTRTRKTTARSGEYNAYKKRFLDLAVNFIDTEFGVIVSGIKDFVSVRRKVKALTWYLAFIIAGLTVSLLGIAKYIECFCPTLGCGLGYIIIGLIAIFIGIICKKLFA